MFTWNEFFLAFWAASPREFFSLHAIWYILHCLLDVCCLTAQNHACSCFCYLLICIFHVFAETQVTSSSTEAVSILGRKKKETWGSTCHRLHVTWREHVRIKFRWRWTRFNDKVSCEKVWMALRWIDEGTEKSGQKSEQSKKWTGKEDDGQTGGRRFCCKQPPLLSKVCASLGLKCACWLERLLNCNPSVLWLITDQGFH